MKKEIKLAAILIVIGIALGSMAFASTRYSAGELAKAIDAIGEVSYSEESLALIDAADAAYARAQANLSVEGSVENLDQLEAAKVEYARLAIKRMYIAIRDGEPEAVITEYLADAEAAYSHFFSEEESGKVRNFADLADARKKYGGPAQPAAPQRDSAPKPAPTPELCAS